MSVTQTTMTPDRNDTGTGLLLATVTTSLGFALVQLDVSIVNVALARIGAGIHVGITGLEWVVDAYTLAFASLMLSAGALGDRFGAKRSFIGGLGLFVLASIGCGLAPVPAVLIATRVVQGMAAALLLPSSLALLNHACHGDQKARAHAIGLWTAAGSVSLAMGPVLGGLLVHWLGWRSIFLVNFPIGLAGIWLATTRLEETERHGGAFDPAGQVLGIVMLAAVTGAVIEAGALGWHSGVVVGCCAVAAASLIGFIAVEAKVREPMLPLSIFALPNVVASVVVGFAVNFAIYGTIFVFNLFLQQKAGYSAIESGLAFLPFPVVLFGANVLAGRLAARFGPKWPMIGGMLVAMVGFVALSLIGPQTPWMLMVPGLVLISAGIGTTVPAMTASLLSAVPKPRAGLASGILNTVRQSGGAIGVALTGSLLAHDGVAGFHWGLIASIPVLIAATVVALLGVTRAS